MLRFVTNSRPKNGYGLSRPGLKTGDKNDIFWSEIVSGFGGPGGIPPPRFPRGTPWPSRRPGDGPC